MVYQAIMLAFTILIIYAIILAIIHRFPFKPMEDNDDEAW
jgi:hypothetical protein